MVPRSVLNVVRQPRERGVLSDSDDHVVDFEALRRGVSIDLDGRSVDGARESRRMQLQGFDLAVAEHCGHSQPVHQFHSFLEHVVEIFGDGWHFLRVGLYRDHGYFDSALSQGFTGAVDGGVSAADHGDASAEFDFGSAHADVAQEGKPVENAVFVFAFGANTIRLGESYGQNAGVVVLFQIVPGNVLADFCVGLDGYAELFEALDFAVENGLRKHPVGNAAAIQSTGFRRFLKDRHRVAEARKLIGGAVAGGTRAYHGDFLAVRRPCGDHVARKGLTQIAEKALDRSN